MRVRRLVNIGIGASWIVILFLFCYLYLGPNLSDNYEHNEDLDRHSMEYEAVDQVPDEPKKNKNPIDHTESVIGSSLSLKKHVSATSSIARAQTPLPKGPLAISSAHTSFTTVTLSPTPVPIPVPDRVIVMGKMLSEDTSWVSSNLPEWQHVIYTVNAQNATHLDSPVLRTSINKGKEAFPYLTYLVSNYDSLPSTIVFLHAHRDGYPVAWHNDAPNYDAVTMLNRLNVDFVQRNGYANLRCIHIPGCPNEVQPFRHPADASRTIETAMPEAWLALFNNTNVPKTLATACCAQFAVSKSQVLKRPLSDYQRYLDWLTNTPLDDDTSGRVFEYLWHIIFGQDPVYCPKMETCWCDVYGQC